MTNPFEEYVNKETKSEVSLVALRQKAEEWSELEMAVESLNEETSQLQKRINRIKQVELPEMMAEIGLNKFNLDDGTSIEINEFVSGSIPKDEEKKIEAFTWLENNELGSIIKTNVSLVFGKGEDNFAKNAVAMLEESGYEPVSEKSVHAQTLQATARELMREGKEVPLETLGLYAGKTAKMKQGKKK